MTSQANGGDQPASHVIFPSEAEAYIRELRVFDIADIGSEKWSLQRERLEQLNMQAVFNVSQQSDEFVKDFLITHEKLPVVVHELLSQEVWREKVFPLMLDKSRKPRTNFPAYLVLYHEGTLVSLLETSLYYQECSEAIESCVLDLVDYCHRRVTDLLGRCEGGEGVRLVEEVESGSSEDEEEGLPSRGKLVKELREQSTTLLFSVNMKVVSILRYITDHLSSLSIGVATRLLNTHDLPCVMVSLLECAPWKKTGEKGQLMKFESNKWTEVPAGERLKVTQLEGQVWLTLYHLLMDRDCQQKYELNSHSKATILKLRGYLTDPLLEQIPPLGDLQRYLHQLSMMDLPPMRRELILEQVPEIHEKLLKSNSGKWSSIAKKHAWLLLEPTPEELQAKAKRWVDASNLDVLETLTEGPPKCAVCGLEASKRCSRCRNEWYCGRECQVGHWKKHKQSCDVIAAVKSS